MTLTCDVDGIAADFVTASQILWDKPVEPTASWYYYKEWSPPLSTLDFWKRIRETGDSFYDNLVQPFPWTEELCEAIRTADPEVVLLSDCSMHPESYQSKLRWVEKWMPGFELFTGKSKYKFASEGNLLIDDNNENIQKWQDRGGKGILFPQPWNANRGIRDRLGFVLERLSDWRIFNHEPTRRPREFRNQEFRSEAERPAVVAG